VQLAKLAWMEKVWDVAVIGAGVFGAWTAYRLAQTGRSVVLFDAYGIADPRSSSGAESRIIRMGYGSNELYTRFSHQSLGMWLDLCEKTGEALFELTGALRFNFNERVSPSRDTMRRAGIAFEELDAEAIARRYPQFRLPPDVTGLFEPESGALRAGAAVRAVVNAARKIGVEFRRERVTVSDGTVRTSSGDNAAAGIYVFACGAWLPKLFPTILGKVIVPTRQPLFFFGLPAGDDDFRPPRLPVWLDDADPRMPYGFPDIDGQGFKMGFHREGREFDPDTGDRIVTAEEVVEAREYVTARFPALDGAPVIATKVCQYENTHTGDFLIDQHPEFPNIWFAGGGSGHGFKHGPAVGDYVVGRLDGRVASEPRFALDNKMGGERRAVV
jgi:sarcosine oxidase